MKKLFLIFTLAFISHAFVFSTGCLPEGIAFETQEQINNFLKNNPGCTIIEGDVTISGNDIQDLFGLQMVESIRGNLNIIGTYSLPSLAGLVGLTSLEGSLQIISTSVTSLYGLNYLHSIGEDLVINNNNSLVTMAGFENITSIGGKLEIYNNYSLISLAGIDNVNAGSVKDLFISSNFSLKTCDIQCICSYLSAPGGTVEIRNNASGCNSLPEVASACGIILPCLPEGPYTFYTQDEIDNFKTNFPGCTQLNGQITISGAGINNLSGLNVIASINGNLAINNTSLENLSGLNNIKTISGYLSVGYNPALTSFTGLNELKSIGGELNIQFNNALTNLSGFNALTSIGGDLFIYDNINLSNVTDLNAMITIGGGLTIGSMWGNSSLTNLAGLENLTSIGGSLTLQNNSVLSSLMGLSNLTTISGNLVIEINSALVTLSGLNKLTSIGGSLSINGNDALTSLAALGNLTSIGGELRIESNYSLTSLTGLDHVAEASISNLSINDNTILSGCNAQSICNYIANPKGTVDIFNNASGCNSAQEVSRDCGIAMPCLPNGNYYFSNQADINNFKTDFNNCSDLTGNVTIKGENITNLHGLSTIKSISGDLNIGDGMSGNSLLTNLTGLDSLISVEGNINISKNNSLSSLTGLNGLTSAKMSLVIMDNQALENLTGLNQISSINGIFTILNNNSLTTLTGLEALTHLGSSLGISSNIMLTSLEGLHNLVSIGDDIVINYNYALKSLVGLENINPASISNLSIYYNTLLSNCEVKSVCDYLLSPGGLIEIHNNATGCNNQSEVEAACPNGIESNPIFDVCFVYPNPSFGQFNFCFNLDEMVKVKLVISNSFGQIVSTLLDKTLLPGIHQATCNTQNIPAGMYYYRLEAGNRVGTGKMILMK